MSMESLTLEELEALLRFTFDAGYRYAKGLNCSPQGREDRGIKPWQNFDAFFNSLRELSFNISTYPKPRHSMS